MLYSLGPFVLITVTLVLTSAVMVLFPTAWITDLMQLVPIPFSFRAFIVIMAGLNLVVSLVCERWVFPKFSKLMGEWWGSRKAKKEEKYQQEQQVFAPPPQHQQNVGGYGSQDLTQRVSQQQGQGVGVVIPVEAGSSAVATAPAPKKTLKKKMSIKVYKMVEDEMMGA